MSKLKVDELQESTTDSNITVASGTNLVVTDSLTVDGDSTFGEDVLNSTPAYTKLAVFGGFFCDTQGYPFVVHDLSMGDNLLEIDGNEGWIKIDPEGQLEATEFGSGIDVSGASTFAGDVLPSADNSKDLGSSSKRWANLYVADAHYSNVGTGGNDVDGTEGSWTIQEGEEDLFLLNRKNGKKFKIKLEEIE